MDVPKLYAESEATSLLKLRPGTLRYWRGLQQGPAFVALGRRIRYSAESSRELLTPALWCLRALADRTMQAVTGEAEMPLSDRDVARVVFPRRGRGRQRAAEGAVFGSWDLRTLRRRHECKQSGHPPRTPR